MALSDHISGTDRKVLNVAIVAVLVALGLGVTFLVTNLPIAKTAMFVAGPIAIVAVLAVLIRTWWPRDDA